MKLSPLENKHENHEIENSSLNNEYLNPENFHGYYDHDKLRLQAIYEEAKFQLQEEVKEVPEIEIDEILHLKVEYEKFLNLEHRVKAQNVETFCGHLNISLFWEEKVLILILMFQLMGLFISAFYEFVPSKAYSYTIVILFFDLNIAFSFFFSLFSTLDNKSNFGIGYGIMWSLGTIAFYGLASYVLLTPGYSQIKRKFHHIFIRLTFYFPLCMVLPCLTNTIPFLYCYKLSSLKTSLLDGGCYSQFSQYVLIICNIIAQCSIIAYAYIHFMICSDAYVYKNNENHEKYLVIKEMEYVFELSTTWSDQQLFLISSFNREHFNIYHRSLLILYLIIISNLTYLLVYSPIALFIIVGIVASAFYGYITVKPPYRVISSNLTYLITLWGTLPNILIFFLRTIEERSALTLLANYFTVFLLLYNSFIFGLVLMSGLLFFCMGLQWPSNKDMVQEIIDQPRLMKILLHLYEARDMHKSLATRNFFFLVYKDKMINLMKNLDYDFKQTAKLDHFFKDIVLEFLEALHVFYPKVLQQALLPHPKLERHIDTLKEVLCKRYRDQVLMNPKKRTVLKYLITFRILFERYWSWWGFNRELERNEKMANKMLNPLKEDEIRLDTPESQKL